ncbi:hypothetical protein ACR2Q0_04950 [Pectobacterium carotovorum]
MKRDLRNWKGNASELMKTLYVITRGLKNFKTRDLREEAIFKKIKQMHFPFFHRYVPATHSNSYGVLNKVHDSDFVVVSKKYLKKCQESESKLLYEIHKQKKFLLLKSPIHRAYQRTCPATADTFPLNSYLLFS